MNILFLILFMALPLTGMAMDAKTERDMVAAVLLAEAGVDGVEGLEGVAEVIATRARERQLTPYEVVTQPKQFASLNGKSPWAVLTAMRRSPLWKQAVTLANRIYQDPGAFRNVTNGANHFTVKTEKPYWANGLKPVVVIKSHAFFKL